MTNRPLHPGARALLRQIALSGLVLAGLTARAPAQDASVWELTPYKVQIFAAFGSPQIDHPRRQAILDHLSARIDGVVGAVWDVTMVEAPRPLASAILDDLEGLTTAQLPPDSLNADKVFVLGVTADSMGWHIRARELDVRTDIWGTIDDRLVRQSELVDDECFRTLVSAFSPLAQIEGVDLNSARLRLRGASLTTLDPTVFAPRRGDLWRPVTRTNNRDGSVKQIRPVDWTYLWIDQPESSPLKGRIYSGMRAALAERRRGRIEKLALKVTPPKESTRLTLLSRTDAKRPLASYDVYAYGPESKETTHLGKTDRQGNITIQPGPSSVRLLLILHGDELLARLPVVPGLIAAQDARISDDDQRLEVEGFINGLQENLVDLVVRREVLMSLVEQNIEKQNRQAAQDALDQLRALPGRQQLTSQIQQEERRLSTTDKRVQLQIERLLGDTKTLVQRYLDPRRMAELESRVYQLPAPASAKEDEEPPPAADPNNSASEQSPATEPASTETAPTAASNGR